MIYLDNAASTPLLPEVADYMHQLAKENFGNPSSIHKFGRESRVLIDDARNKIAGLLNVEPSEIYFTSGGTEACNMLINGAVKSYGIRKVITSPIEHPAVLNTLKSLKDNSLVDVEFLRIDEEGNPDLDQLESILSEREQKLVCLMHANNEIGNLLSVNKVNKICKLHNALFFSDTVQTMAKYPNDLKSMGFDFATCSAHKFHGPKGIGFAYIKKDRKIPSFIKGGGQERNLRAGTENVHSIAGMALAMKIAYRTMEKDIEHIFNLKRYFISELKAKIAGIEFNGTCENNGLYNLINVSFPKTENTETIHLNLDIEGIAVSAGSACASGSIRTSHVIKELKKDLSRPVLRFSMSKFNNKDVIDATIKYITRLM